jgi:DNA repair protein RecO (recombination protein O)
MDAASSGLRGQPASVFPTGSDSSFVAATGPRWYQRPHPPVPIELTTPAFVLRTRPYGESDLIVTFITEQHGKVTGIGKGARNSKRRFPGTLQPFLHVRVVFTQRPTSDLAFLLRCELIEALRGITTDVDRFAAASYVLDVTDRIVLGRESGAEIYALVRDALGLLAAGAAPDPLLRALEMHLLCASGWAPVFDRCRGCDAPADTALFLSVERGGLLCRRCVPVDHPVLPVGAETAAYLTRLALEPLAEAGPGQGLAEAARVTEELLAAVTSGPLRSRSFLSRTRVDSPTTLR